MWRSTLVTTMVLLCSVPAQAAQSCQRIVQVGAWNIQWLGNAKEGKRQAQAPEDLASYIAASKVEILALSEISATGKDSAGRFRNQTLDDALALLNDQGARWDYEIFEKRPGARAESDQWIGVAWNAASVTKTGGPWKLPVQVDEARENSIRSQFPKPTPDTIIFSRWPYAIKFSAGTGLSDWVIVPIHLKSNTEAAPPPWRVSMRSSSCWKD